MKIALDVMGGDNAPHSNIIGAKRFLEDNKNASLILVGDQTIINAQLREYNLTDNHRIEIHHASEVVTMNEKNPSKSFKTKPDSSIVQSVKLVKEGKAGAVISAGNTGALLSSSLFILGKINGIKRPTLATHFPTRSGGFILSDVGANTDVKPIHLLQFAVMGSVYSKYIKNIKSAEVGLLNIGAEENKGNALTQAAYSQLKENINGFIGNIEPRYLFDQEIDVVVCDGFAGNVFIKLTEGLSAHLNSWINSKSEIESNRDIASTINKVFDNYNYESHGASPFLGVKGIVLKCHGACSHKSVTNALSLATTLSEKDIITKIEEDLENNPSLSKDSESLNCE